MNEGNLIKKLFRSNWFFWPFYTILMVLVFVGTTELVGTIKEINREKKVFQKKLKKEAEEVSQIQKELDRRAEIIVKNKEILKELDARIAEKNRLLEEIERKIDRRLLYRWHSYDMRFFCEELELKNAHLGLTCPSIDEILEMTRPSDKRN